MTLHVKGSALSGNISGGPVLCEHRNPNQCYRPSKPHELHVKLSSAPTRFTVRARGDANVTASPASQSVNFNGTGTVTLSPRTGYKPAIATNTCGGSLAGNTYTTGPVTQNCAVTFSSSLYVAVAAGFYSGPTGTRRPLLASSNDAGATWTYPESITAPVFTPNNSNPFASNGQFDSASCTGSTCIAAGYYSDTTNTQRPLLARSIDAGATWTFPESITAPVFTPNNSYPFSRGEFRGASSTF